MEAGGEIMRMNEVPCWDLIFLVELVEMDAVVGSASSELGECNVLDQSSKIAIFSPRSRAWTGAPESVSNMLDDVNESESAKFKAQLWAVACHCQPTEQADLRTDTTAH